MVCDCCGRRKKLFESFAEVQYEAETLHFCVECNDIAYKVRDDFTEKNKENLDRHMKDWETRSKKPSKPFLKWKKEFLFQLEQKNNQPFKPH